MPKTRLKRRLVIDASVAQAASPRNPETEGKHYHSAANCAKFLDKARDICHRVVMTQEIFDEWKSHQSKFAFRWLVSMKKRKGKYCPIEAVSRGRLWERMEQCLTSDDEKHELAKDMLLIRAALDADRIIVSLDDTMRRLLVRLSARVGEIGDIVWVNPNEADALSWLEKGAKREASRQLRSMRAE